MKIKILFNKALLYFSYVFKLEKSLGKPIIKLIEPTNACMMNCIMCPRKNMKRKIEFMDLNFFKKIIDQAKWNDNIWVHYYGDPLLHPYIIPMIEYTSKKGIIPRLITNPNLLTEKMCNQLVNSGLHTLGISIDGVDDKTYKHIRGPNANYTRAIKNINLLLQIKNKNKSKMKIFLTMVHMKANKYDCEKFKELWNKKGIDELVVSPLSILDSSDKTLVEQGDNELFSKQFKNKENNYCVEPWIGVTVTVDGKVLVCCNDYDEKYILGDLKENSLEEIWNNDKMKLLRRQVRDKKLHTNPLCKNCWERNNRVLSNQIRYFFNKIFPTKNKK